MILSRCLGSYAVTAAADTTSAGLRQHLGRDARPVIIDEVEGTDSTAQGRIQGVLALARQSSSASGRIWKGTQGGDAISYETRASFAFCSINVGLKEHADATRTSVLTFMPDLHGSAKDRADKFEAVIKPLHAELLTPAFVSGLQARGILLAATIVKNAETLAAVGASPLLYGSRRAGDQIGTLMAGAHALLSDDLIAPESAEEWLRREAPPGVAEASDDAPDERKLLWRILQTRVRIHNGTAAVEYTLGDLARRLAFTAESDAGIPGEEAMRHLRMHGMRVEGNELWVSNTHTALAKLLTGSTWAHNWGATLARLPGVRPLPPKSFGAAGLSRGQAVPLDVVFPGTEDEVSE
jgi:putative DNA primase/helicase